MEEDQAFMEALVDGNTAPLGAPSAPRHSF
jgi:hypothetical protein